MIDLVLENDKRKEVMEKLTNLEILDSVKNVLMLGNTDFVTVKMAADYYDVGLEAINSLIKDNRKELEENGLLVLSGKETKNILVKSFEDITNYKGYFEANGQKFANRSNILISKRVLLNIGMLLRDSEVAKELRKRILDIVFDAEESKGSIETVVKEINEEEQLQMEIGKAFALGDLNKFAEATLKLTELRNKRIVELENEVEELSPLANKYNIFLDTNGLTDIEKFSKNLSINGMGRNKMYKYLRNKGFLMENNIPYQKYIDKKYFVVKPSGYHLVNGEKVQDYKTFLTSKGVNKIIDELIKDNILNK